jgi:hypothetical protein
MPDPLITDQDIADAALGPQSATVDGESATAHPLKDLLEVRKQLDQNTAVSRRDRGLRFTKLSPPGAS